MSATPYPQYYRVFESTNGCQSVSNAGPPTGSPQQRPFPAIQRQQVGHPADIQAGLQRRKAIQARARLAQGHRRTRSKEPADHPLRFYRQPGPICRDRQGEGNPAGALGRSRELQQHTLILRFLSVEANIGHDKLRWGNLDDADWPWLTAAEGRLASKRIFIDEGSLTIRQLRIRAWQLHRRMPLCLIVVDYLQLVQGGDQNRTQEIASVSCGLKALAKKLGVPVLAVSQLNREVERRDNKRPVLADLRDSGQIEQDADTVVFVYRDEVYHDDSADWGCAEVIIAKERNYPTGTVSLAFRGGLASFGNLAGLLLSGQIPSKWNGNEASVFRAYKQAH